MSSYKEVLRQAVTVLEAAQIPEADADAWQLFSYVTGMRRAEYFMKLMEEMPKAYKEQYDALLEQRCQRIPLQYITGSQEFMGFEFLVSPATLIPRQDTEILVEEAARSAEGKRVLDICTGTGCILLSLAKLCKLSGAVGTDIVPEAVETAGKNAERLEIPAEFYCGDLFQAVPAGERFDMIVSNPPYIPSKVIDTLMPEVRDYEPVTALDGDSDGLKFYREIIRTAPEYLTEHGEIFFEIGCEQAADVSALLKVRGFEDIRVIKDLAGLDRVVCAVWKQKRP
ncbi:MAG: peptide chain release factor N(5)-glutamine methyltransferase [Lachnospiraceae bacterium]|nr:peptide chain release factor N(5)-glutamine methyltransferase [Lachnospiraceae bacterium]